MLFDREIFGEDHDIFRQSVRKFMEREVVPHHERWEKQGQIDREAWTKAGQAGLLCPNLPEEYGGPGADFLYSTIVIEELAYVGATGPGFSLHSDIVAPYILHHGSEDLKRKWLPKFVSGETIGAIAMTEPGTGSDLQGVKTTAVKDGNHLVINGSKTFITNGQLADLVVVVTKTDEQAGAKGISLVLVETDREGFSRGRNLDKIGLKAQDTSELFFDDVKVPATNMLGDEGQGFAYLMQELPQERLQVGIAAVAACEAALKWTIEYTKERQAFGKPIAEFQNSRFKLAEMKTETRIARVFLDDCLTKHTNGGLDVETAAMAKWWTTDLQCKVIDQCLQLFGGYGYMWEYPIARAYADARVQRIYAGTNEIMKELIGRGL
ncbi:MAG: acyl-CoA dehydrogenase family protein [Alphaproteobacteria bacterium]|jgi:acyl-CoA dehydrogenase|nr:acyl-CoA dehydrogenase [Rhodospirillaceae bacterium]MDP6407661.1 acyl-CoA dehydrogenase family protein [Alphaproteobacteria bacterium]MDP6622419.1 acyl-CoA dehydrogenase family protein [Alphaproteobacteria bacterium]|tara:strand:- start:322 stop:1461 length:1140 start_codon:yes stop_codon:yes gene_type:complete